MSDLNTLFHKIKELSKTAKEAAGYLIETGEIVDRDLAEQRMSICNACPYKKGNYCGDGDPTKDKTCGCYLPAKIKLVVAECPYEKW